MFYCDIIFSQIKEWIYIFNDDIEYSLITNDILTSSEFLKIKNIIHHSLNRYDHSVRVSYYSYKIAKFLKLDYVSTARAGLLHDFFLIDNKNITLKERAFTLINHPKYSLNYSLKFFELNDKERDIIVTHMFPICPTRLPKYLESWIVDLVDDVISIKEELYAKRKILANSMYMFMYYILMTK